MTATIGDQAMGLWQLALALGLVVTIVVAILLHVLHGRARLIEQTVGSIWGAGQRVANNTVHVVQLYRTADGVERILGHAGRIAGHAAAIEAHAAACPGCPQCLWRR
jgi:hypothetical protein